MKCYFAIFYLIFYDAASFFQLLLDLFQAFLAAVAVTILVRIRLRDALNQIFFFLPVKSNTKLIKKVCLKKYM
jgi:hypothetical protein